MPPLPLFLNIEGSPVLVVGGGRAAFLKLRALFRAGAKVTVIAKRLSPKVAALVSRNKTCTVRLRNATPRDVLVRYRLLFPLTDDESLNTRLVAAARAKRIWVGGSGDPARADFAFGATVDQAGVRVAISTGGASPALARLLARRLKTAMRDLLPHGTLAALPDRKAIRAQERNADRRRTRLVRAARQSVA
jgi:uroporphyrin-III C-methyltransferase/precorrin-2 dehydrogenase/sirohydrochlorin ferrochelatase